MEDGLWLSLFSGRPRGELSRHSYREPVDGAYEIALADPSAPVAVPMLWDAPARAGRRVVVLDVPSLPPDPSTPADQLSDWGVHGPKTAMRSSPAEIAREVVRAAPQMDILRDHVEGAGDETAFLDQILESVARRGRIARGMLERGRLPDLAVVVFSEVHTAGHRLWHDQRSLRRVYSAVDREVGALAGLLGPEASTVVVAGNGLERRGPVDALMADFCRRLGYAPAPPRRGRPADLAARGLPRRLRGLAARGLGRGGVDRVIARRFRGAYDWPRTRAFAIPDAFVGMLRVNLAGREPAGPVQPGEDYESTVAALEEDLLALRDPRTGKPAVSRVARFRGDRGGPPPRSPDVVALIDAHEPPLLELEHPRATIRQPEPWWAARNGHAGRGMVVAAGPRVAAIGEATGPLACLDLAPTILALMGEPADGLPGRPAPAFSGSRPPEAGRSSR
jgi:predicted AlkP superfamily phosphohydrolase/phosphomutase